MPGKIPFLQLGLGTSQMLALEDPQTPNPGDLYPKSPNPTLKYLPLVSREWKNGSNSTKGSKAGIVEALEEKTHMQPETPQAKHLSSLRGKAKEPRDPRFGILRFRGEWRSRGFHTICGILFGGLRRGSYHFGSGPRHPENQKQDSAEVIELFVSL